MAGERKEGTSFGRSDMRPIVLARISRGKIFRIHEIPRVVARPRVKYREIRARSVSLVVTGSPCTADRPPSPARRN